MKKFLIVTITFNYPIINLVAAEAGMPQLDPEFWASQAFWLIIIFLSIYLLISKIFIPKIKANIDTREDKIRKDLEEAKTFKEEAEKKLEEYKKLIETAKLDSKKILYENRLKLNDEIQEKKNKIQNEIEQETLNAEKEIKKFKSDSIKKVGIISEEIVSDLLKGIIGEDGNKSSIKATVSEVIKQKKEKNEY
jgi:F-type H+-transporting ATPase subunit b